MRAEQFDRENRQTGRPAASTQWRRWQPTNPEPSTPASADSPAMNCAYGSAMSSPFWPNGTRSPPPGGPACGRSAKICAGGSTDSTPAGQRKARPQRNGFHAPVPGLLRPNRFACGTASVGCRPATICACVALRTTPFWLTGNASVAATAVAASSLVDGRHRFSLPTVIALPDRSVRPYRRWWSKRWQAARPTPAPARVGRSPARWSAPP